MVTTTKKTDGVEAVGVGSGRDPKEALQAEAARRARERLALEVAFHGVPVQRSLQLYEVTQAALLRPAQGRGRAARLSLAPAKGAGGSFADGAREPLSLVVPLPDDPDSPQHWSIGQEALVMVQALPTRWRHHAPSRPVPSHGPAGEDPGVTFALSGAGDLSPTNFSPGMPFLHLTMDVGAFVQALLERSAARQAWVDAEVAAHGVQRAEAACRGLVATATLVWVAAAVHAGAGKADALRALLLSDVRQRFGAARLSPSHRPSVPLLTALLGHAAAAEVSVRRRGAGRLDDLKEYLALTVACALGLLVGDDPDLAALAGGDDE